MKSIVFRYGSFFGLSAVHLMFMDKSDIDVIFSSGEFYSHIALSNLYREVDALQHIFRLKSGETLLENLPQVIMTEDASSQEVKDLIQGFNCLVEDKQKKSEQTAISNDTDTTVQGEETDLLNSVNVSRTSFFADDNVAQQEDDPLAALFNSDGSDDIDLGGLMDSLSEEENDSSDEFAGLGDIDLDALAADLTDSPSSREVDLIALGKSRTPSKVTVTSVIRLRRYLREHREAFTNGDDTSELDAILQQLEDLPKRVTSVSAPAFVTKPSALSDQNRQILQTIYSRMTRRVTAGESHLKFIDYVQEKLGLVLMQTADTAVSVLYSKESFVYHAEAYSSWYKILNSVTSRYLSESSSISAARSISIALQDCDSLLGDGIDSTLAFREALDSEYADKKLAPQKFLGEATFAPDEWERAGIYFERLYANKDLEECIYSKKNLRFILSLYLAGRHAESAMQSVCSGADFIDQCVAFTEETYVCGFGPVRTESIEEDIMQFGLPLVENRQQSLSASSVHAKDAVSLLRKNLISARKRLEQ